MHCPTPRPSDTRLSNVRVDDSSIVLVLSPGQWLSDAFEGLAQFRGREASFDGAGVVGRELEAEETAAQLLGDCQGRAAAAEG